MAIDSSGRSVAFVDIDSSDLSASEKRAFLAQLRSKMQKWNVWAVVSEAEQEDKLTVNSIEKLSIEEAQKKSKEAFERLSSRLNQAKEVFSQSQFPSAISLFEAMTEDLSVALFDLNPEFTREFFQYFAASKYFDGSVEQAREIYRSLRRLDPLHRLDVNKFPPDLIEALEVPLRNRDEDFKTWKFSSTQKDFELRYFGFSLPILESSNQYEVVLPPRDRLLDQSKILLMRDGMITVLVDPANAPSEIKWISSEAQKKHSRGLFAAVGRMSPPAELKSVMQRLGVSVVLLSTLSRQGDMWTLEGQWFEGRTNRLSVLKKVKSDSLAMAGDSLIDDLVAEISSDGRVIDPERPLDPRLAQKINEDKNRPYYKQWWFWAATGLAVAGVGVGTYYVLNSKDVTKFQLRAVE